VRAPLIPLPIISQPFERIAMDIVGPLPRSARGNRFVLVVCDYATRYPEAIPMKSIDASSVAEELVTIFSRVGVPKEVLIDQGSNFTSQLLSELYKMLHVQPIRTTPYHPQTDGLVERFNQTLKTMLRKVSGRDGKDWDKLLPYLLFAYREVPQASTGFSRAAVWTPGTWTSQCVERVMAKLGERRRECGVTRTVYELPAT